MATKTSTKTSPAKQPKATTGAKMPATSTHKILIRDACAAPRCMEPPAKGSIYCEEHGAAMRAETSAKATAAAKAPKKAASARVLAEVVAMPPTGAVPAAPTEAAAHFPTAPAVIEELRRRGWSDFQVGAAVGVGENSRRSTVWAWRKGKTCTKLAELQALLAFAAPEGKRVEKKVKAAVKAARVAVARKPERRDQRQLMLDLRNALNLALGQVG